MRDFRDDLKAGGYSQEEAYFHKHNLKLIQKLRERAGKKDPNAPDDEDLEDISVTSAEYEEKKAA